MLTDEEDSLTGITFVRARTALTSLHGTRTTWPLGGVSVRVWGGERSSWRDGEALQTGGRAEEQGGGGAQADVRAPVCVSAVSPRACACTWL